MRPPNGLLTAVPCGIFLRVDHRSGIDKKAVWKILQENSLNDWNYDSLEHIKRQYTWSEWTKKYKMYLSGIIKNNKTQRKISSTTYLHLLHFEVIFLCSQSCNVL